VTDPVRFSDEADPALALLLRAGQKELPPRGALEKTLSGLGAATAVIGVSHGAAAATAGKLGLWTLAKWAGAGILSGAITVGGVELIQQGIESRRRAVDDSSVTAATPAERAIEPRQSPASFSPVSPLAAPSARATAAMPESHEVAAGKRDGRTAVSSIRRSEPVASDVDRAIAVEIALIDEARRALRAGDPASALETLNRHRSEVERPRLEPEAQYLRMEAFAAAGNGAAAQRAASALLERYPKGPHAARARAILERGGPRL